MTENALMVQGSNHIIPFEIDRTTSMNKYGLSIYSPILKEPVCLDELVGKGRIRVAGKFFIPTVNKSYFEALTRFYDKIIDESMKNFGADYAVIEKTGEKGTAIFIEPSVNEIFRCCFDEQVLMYCLKKGSV